MAVENPPLNRIHVLGYTANDRNYPIVSLVADPRVAGYRVPEDLSACPDKRYPNHVFTGAQPLSGDERVRHTWEILPSPYVPFTRYDDDLGPVQGRRRFVVNSGQEASLERDKKVSYEAREGSAIVSSEIEETWDGGSTDPDLESPFPIKDRDFYDPSRGPVQERRQLVSTTGNEVASLQNNNGVVIQTSYEAYNEYLSFKVVQTYNVNGPRLIGQATDNDGQLVKITTQRKGASNYTPPDPTATRTVEVNREDAASLVERIVDTPEVFKANTFSVERPDPIPQKFRVAVPVQSSQEIVVGDADPNVSLGEGEISKSEEQRNKFIKRVSSTSRSKDVLPKTLIGKSTNNERQEVTVTEILQLGDTIETPTATKTVGSEALGDGNFVITKTEVPEVFSAKILSTEAPDPVPQKFRIAAIAHSTTTEETVTGDVVQPVLATGEFAKSEQQQTKFTKRTQRTSRPAVTNGRLAQKATNEVKQVETITETLQTGDTGEAPTATKNVESEALGDGTYVVRTTEVDDVFEAKTFSIEAPDPAPQKFRIAAPATTTEETVTGPAALPVLAQGEFAKSETQQTKFTKRTRETLRSAEDLPKTLAQKSTNEVKQVETITEVFQTGDTSEVPSATKSVESEALGDGTYVVRTTEVDKVFEGKLFSLEGSDPAPLKFRLASPAVTTEEMVEGTAAQPVLTTGFIVKSEQQVNKFVKRLRSTFRNLVKLPTILRQTATDNDRQKVTVTETIQTGDTSDVPTALKTVNSESLGDGTYVVTTAEVDKVFDAQTFRSERGNLVPQKFRFDNPVKTTEETVEGTAAEITLAEDEILKTEQQINKFVKKVTTQSATKEVDVILEEKILTQEGQLATRALTLSSGEQVIIPSALLIDGNIEDLGGGQTIKTETTVETIFDGRQESREKPETIPAEFRAEAQSLTVSEIKQGKAVGVPQLAANQISITQQRITEDKIRETTVTRPVQNYPELNDTIYDNTLTKVDRTRKVDKNNIPIVPSATVSGTVENLGGGYTLKTEDTKEELFDSLTASKQKADTIPEKFRVNSPIKKVEKILAQEEVEEDLTLGVDEYSKTEQRLTKFTVQQEIVTRENTLNEIKNSRLEENWGIQIPYTEKILSGGETSTGEYFEEEGLSDVEKLVREYTTTEIDTTLDAYIITFPTTIDLDLPRVLDDITVNFQTEKSDSNLNFVPTPIEGSFRSLTQQDEFSVSSTLSIVPKIEIKFKDIWGKNIPATTHLFFIKKDEITEEKINEKCGDSLSWPVFKLKSFSTTVFGKSERKEKAGNVSTSVQINDTTDGYGWLQTETDSNQSGNTLIPVLVDIPPCLTKDFFINESETLEATKLRYDLDYPELNLKLENGSVITKNGIGIAGELEHNLTVDVKFTIPATDTEDVPTSDIYRVSTSIEPYKFGWFLVRATTFDASIFA